MGFNSNMVILWIVLINTVLSLVYMVAMWLKKRSIYVFQRGVTMVLCPVVGILCFLFSFLVDLMLRKEDVDYESLSIDKTRKKFLQPVDKERELEMLPLEEVLAVSNTRDKRRAMLNMLRLDARENLTLVRKAAENDDSETSHYAATALTDALGRFTTELNGLQVAYDKDRANLQANQELLDAVLRILNSGGLLKVEENKYRYMLIELVQNLDKNHPEAITPAYYAAMVRALHGVGRFKEAEEWAELSLERLPEAEESHLNVMYIKYALGKKEEFDEALKRLTGSSVSLSEEGLRIVRFWLAK
ncbi:MAG: hypothetical protein K2M42_04210 [Oscillospiraceae bacterium]|nr:hypothetical protein [Oscillospiraceae bacterium]